MKMLPWRCSFARLSTTVFLRNESHWIASATARKKRPTRTLSLSCGKSIMPNAAAIPKRVMFSTATVFIGDLVKSNGINRLTIAGIVTNRRKSSSTVNQFKSDGAKAEKNLDRQTLQRLLPAGAARNALDCALWDLEAKISGKRVWELANIPSVDEVETSFTISLDMPDKMATATKAAANSPVLKLK